MARVKAGDPCPICQKGYVVIRSVAISWDKDGEPDNVSYRIFCDTCDYLFDED